MAKQKEDKATRDLLASANAKKQKKFRDSQKAKGLKRVMFWATPEQEAAIKKFINSEGAL